MNDHKQDSTTPKPMLFVTRALNKYERAIRAEESERATGYDPEKLAACTEAVTKARRRLEKIIQDERDNWSKVFDDLIEARKELRDKS